MIYELRIYQFYPNKKRRFLLGFKKSKAFMSKYGMTFIAAWENLERADEFVWIRAFPSLKARDRATRAFYSSREWLAIVDMLKPAIRRREVRLMKSVGLVNRLPQHLAGTERA